MTYPEILDAEHVADAADLVRRYYRPVGDNTTPRTGTRFDGWAGGGDRLENVDRITADDLVAVFFLSVDIKGPAAIGLLETHSDEITDLLRQIPADLNLWDADINRLDDPNKPEYQLWNLLRGHKYGKWDVGPTRASKIMARKRPRLIPIYDSVVHPLMGLKNSGGYWAAWHIALTDGTDLPARLETIRQEAISVENAEHLERISALRVMDIVLWMRGIDQGLAPDDDDIVADEED